MCARYCFLGGPTLRELFRLNDIPDTEPLINIAPTMWVPSVVQSTAKRELRMMQWGFLPSWQSDPTHVTRPINARSESIVEKPMFKSAFEKRRCLLPAHGFYEWSGDGRSKKCHWIGREDGAPFALAGVWDFWEGHGGAIESFAIVTTGPSEQMSRIHDRMPVMLNNRDFEIWLGSADEAESLLHAYPGALDIHEVESPKAGPSSSNPQATLFD